MNIDQRAPTFLINQLNALLDSGRFDGISTQDVHLLAQGGGTLKWLRDLAPEIDLSPFQANGPYAWFEPYFDDFLRTTANVSDDSRHFGVRNRGLCLLIAWTNELIRRGYGWKPTEDIPRNRSPD
jgi:hypothetical protein